MNPVGRANTNRIKRNEYLFLLKGVLSDPLSITWTIPQASSANLKAKQHKAPPFSTCKLSCHTQKFYSFHFITSGIKVGLSCNGSSSVIVKYHCIPNHWRDYASHKSFGSRCALCTWTRKFKVIVHRATRLGTSEVISIDEWEEERTFLELCRVFTYWEQN